MLCVFGYSLSLLTQTFWATVGFSSFTVFLPFMLLILLFAFILFPATTER